MTFLDKLIHVDPPRKFFQIFEEKCFDHFPEILTYDVILAPKMSHFHQFSPKMTYLAKLTPLMTFLVKFIHGDPPGIIFPNFWRKMFLTTFPKF